MKNNEKGFALIQVIIAASIFSVLALTMSSLIVKQQQATAYLEDQLLRVQLIRNIETVLKDGLACQKTLEGVKIPPIGQTATLEGLKDNAGANLYQSNTNDGKLSVGQLLLLNQSVAAPNSKGFVKIEVPISRVRIGGGPREFRSYEATLSVEVDGSSNPSSCSTGGEGTLDWANCIIEKDYVSGGTKTVNCPVDYHMVTGMCARSGTEDLHPNHCQMLPNGIQITSNDDGWTATLKCCPEL